MCLAISGQVVTHEARRPASVRFRDGGLGAALSRRIATAVDPRRHREIPEIMEKRNSPMFRRERG